VLTCIAADTVTGEVDWRAIHAALRANLGKGLSDQKWLPKLDRIKKAGWDMHDAVANRLTPR
jgi:hypothetical protein